MDPWLSPFQILIKLKPKASPQMTKSLNLKNQLRKFISCFGQLNPFHLILASENIGSLFRTNPIR